jgi:hypothetical protein
MDMCVRGKHSCSKGDLVDGCLYDTSHVFIICIQLFSILKFL